MKASTLAHLIETHRPGHSLEQVFYTDLGVFVAEWEYIWKRYWLFTRTTAEIPKPRDYFFGLLTDRVEINSGEKQIYGTLVRYNSLGQAYPKPLFDSVNVNKRRGEIGLEPLEQYLDMMTLTNFEMNKDLSKSRGITEPQLYNDSITIKFER